MYLQGYPHADNAEIFVPKNFTSGPLHFTTANMFIILIQDFSLECVTEK